MSNDVTATPSAPATVTNAQDDTLIDRPFLMQMARVPVIALGFAVVGWLSSLVHLLYGPVVCICVGMIVAAVIDGWMFKVPNWLTLPLIVSGWLLGLINSFGGAIGDPTLDSAVRGGIGAAILCTAVGFFLLFPILFMGGMGQGDVKMQMGFGSWVGVLFGGTTGPWVVLYAFVIGAITGGVFGLVMMAIRRQFHLNARNFGEIITDLRVMITQGPARAAARANARRSTWVRLPYGVPLCVGFVGYLVFRLGGYLN